MNETLEDILNLIKDHRLKEALVQISAIASEGTGWMLRNEIEEWQTSYDLMLQYALRGMKDPNQHQMYSKLNRKVYELAERACLSAALMHPSSTYHFMKLDLQKNPPHRFGDIQMELEAYTEDLGTAPLLYRADRLNEEMQQIRNRHEKALDTLFNKVWVSDLWTEADAIGAESLFNSLLVPTNDLCVLVSAVTMSLLELFDIRKYLFLLQAYKHENITICIRALVGIALVSTKYHERIMMYPHASYELGELCEDPDFCKDLLLVQKQLLISKETRNLEQKMQNEIIPAMMKKSSDKKSLETLKDLDNWNPNLDDEGYAELDKKMKEMGELQLAGADLQMSSFAQLKYFPFFRKTSHWFYPFDKQYPEIASFIELSEKESEQNLFNSMLSSSLFCDSDKYSFCLMFSSLPKNQQDRIVVNINGREDLPEELKKKAFTDTKGKRNKAEICQNYIHDLYRFFKLSHKVSKQKDVFSGKLSLWDQQDIGPAISQSEELKKLADYQFHLKDLDTAIELYQTVISQNKTDAGVLQRAGYCLQRKKRYEEAIKYYQQADLLDAGSQWTIMHLAQCCYHTNQYKEALLYAQELNLINPDNLNATYMQALCLTGLEHYDEALPLFYKVSYLNPEAIKAKESIGQCLTKLGKYQEAIKLYEELLTHPDANQEDWIFAGYAYWQEKNYGKAGFCFKTVYEQFPSSAEFRAFVMDKIDLSTFSEVDKEDIFILMDGIL